MTTYDMLALIQDLQVNPNTPLSHPSIWGGEIAADRVIDFLAAWQPAQRNLPWRICEWVSDLRFEYQAPDLPELPEYLELVHYFGAGGDLLLRRDNRRWSWRFVGPNEARLPDDFVLIDDDCQSKELSGPFGVADYWAARPARGLQEETRHVLLWGKKQGPADASSDAIFWQEDRVAGVHRLLQYQGPWGNHRPDRVRLRYSAFLKDGNVEAVWWLGLEAAEEVSHE